MLDCTAFCLAFGLFSDDVGVVVDALDVGAVGVSACTDGASAQTKTSEAPTRFIRSMLPHFQRLRIQTVYRTNRV